MLAYTGQNEYRLWRYSLPSIMLLYWKFSLEKIQSYFSTVFKRKNTNADRSSFNSCIDIVRILRSSLTKSGLLKLFALNQGFPNLNTLDNRGWIIICCGGSSLHCSMFSDICGFYTFVIVAHGVPLGCDKQNVSKHFQMSSGEQIYPSLKNHCSRRIIFHVEIKSINQSIKQTNIKKESSCHPSD